MQLMRNCAPIRPWHSVVMALALLHGMLGCNQSSEGQSRPSSSSTSAPAAGAALRVAVPIAPIAFFVERIGGPHVSVLTLIPVGQSMHTYDPTARQIAELGHCSVYCSLGLPFERKVVEVVRGGGSGTVVDLRNGLTLRDMEVEDPSQAAHEGHAHEAGEKDPHIWLSPAHMKIAARTMCDALAQAAPQHAGAFRDRLRGLLAELDSVDAEIRGLLEPLRGRSVFVYHPSYGYFCDDYGLRQVPVEIAGREPTARELTELIGKARSQAVRVIFVQPQFSRKCAEALSQQVGAAVISLDPLSRDYLKNLLEMARQVRDGLAR